MEQRHVEPHKLPVEPTDLIDLLQRRATHQADRRAFDFLENSAATPVTYAELDRRARQVGAALQRRASPGQRALLLYPPGLEYLVSFFGCLYAGVIAVPAYPPDPARLGRTLPRLQAIVADAQAMIALTTEWIVSLAHDLAEVAPDLGSLEWIGTDRLAPGSEAGWQRPDLGPHSLAFLQYTSGSTRAPRGVMLSHHNLLSNLAATAVAFGTSAETRLVTWLPPYHDMGLIGGLLHPVYRGFRCVYMSPTDFLRRPLSWLEAITLYGATISGGPNFAYDLCVRRSTPEDRARLDLSTWRLAFNGAEPVRAQTLANFAAAFAPSGFRAEAFYPCYGLAEATLFVSGGLRGTPPVSCSLDREALKHNEVRQQHDTVADAVQLTSVGQLRAGEELLIVDPETHLRCPAQRVGEIWVRGPSVAEGYWNRPDESNATFRAYTADDGSGPFLRTGDLGFLLEGQLYITGRSKDLIIIDGRNHYPQDIELTVEQSHSAIRQGCTAAFAIERDGAERLIAVAEVERSVLEAAGEAGDQLSGDVMASIVSAARRAVAAAHNIGLHALVLLRPGRIPKTSSGKIQRGACRTELIEGTLETLAVSITDTGPLVDVGARERARPALSHDELLAAAPEGRRAMLAVWLQAIVAAMLRRHPDTVSLDESLSIYGVDSLGAAELTSTIEVETGVSLSAVHILRGDTLAQIVEQLQAGLGTASAPASADAAPGSFPLSYGQRAMWFLQQLTPSSPVYTLTNGARLRGDLDEVAFRRALQRLSERHPALRTIFPSSLGEPTQEVLGQTEVALSIEDATGWSEADLARRLELEVYRPFDLERGPLFRVSLFRRSQHEAVVLLAAHHIVTDFWSLALLFYELKTLYDAETTGLQPWLPMVTAPYATYVRWEQATIAGEHGERLWQYWQQQLAGALPVLDLPTDRPRAQTPSYRGATRSMRVGPGLSRAVAALARDNGATTFMAVLTAFYALLHRYTGQDDLIVGVPRAARRPEWERSMGYFVNTLPIRASIAPGASFIAQLDQVRQTALAAIEHAEYPFALMVERLQQRRDLSRSPVFQVMLAWQKTVRLNGADALTPFALNQSGGVLAFGEARLESLALPQRVVPFDLTLLAGEADGELFFSFEYNNDLFDEATIDRMLGHLVTLLEGIVATPEEPIARLPLLTEGERHQLLAGWSDDAAPPEPAAWVHEQFAAQAARRPDATALVWWEATGMAPLRMSYGELDARANQLANTLRARGVGPEAIVGLCVERSPEMIVGLLGVLKAGGVFLPLDPAYPLERLRFMLSDSRAVALLTQEHLIATIAPAGAARDAQTSLEIIRLDADWPMIAAAGDLAPAQMTRGEDAAYVIYTSGSTGTPKGVVIEHQALAAHCLTVGQHYELGAGDRVLQFTSLNFDPALEQILTALLSGAELVLRPGTLWTADEFWRHVVEQGLSVINIPPAYWQELVAAQDEGDSPPHRLRLIIIGGDQIQPESIARWRRSPLAGVRLLNAYGPTETTITATTYEIGRGDTGDGRGPVPIGRPLAGRSAYVLDRHGNLAPLGVPGELWLGGTGVARGYLHRPELTAERFAADPFHARQGARCYRTGDLVRLRPDGNLEFLGRIDQQLKIRGFRIEPGEIESLLRRHPAVGDALVIAHEEPGGEKRLVAYVVAATAKTHAMELGGTSTPPPAAARPTGGTLRSHLRQNLPEFMVPERFIEIERWPLTPNGKIDRRALPPPDAETSGPEASYTAPRNAVEANLAELWGELLGRTQVGVHDNFFELGGHSLLATRLIVGVREAFRVELPLRSLFDRPTIGEMAAALIAELTARDDGQLGDLLDVLEELSDEEVRQMLEGDVR